MRTRKLAGVLWELGKLKEKFFYDGEFDRGGGVEAAIKTLVHAEAEAKRERELRRQERARTRLICERERINSGER